MSQEPNSSQQPTSDSDPQPNHYQPPYPSKKQDKSLWVWLIPLLLVVLGAGMMAGRFWAQQDISQADNSVSDESTTGSSTTLAATEEGDEEVQTTKNAPVLTVEIITPQQAIVQDALSADGTITAKNTATVNGKVSGVTIEQVLVEEGDRVEEGQVLAVFDTDAMEQQAYQAEADLMEAQTRLSLAQADVERITPLLDIKAISEQERDRYYATANQAQASVDAAKARLKGQQLNLTNAQVTAPVAGIISEKTANVGSAPGQAPLFTIIENGQLEWRAQVDPNKLGDINVGTPVQVSLPNNKSVKGRVDRIAPTADQGSRQVSIYVTLENSPFTRAGMYQRGTFILGNEGKQVLPISAIVNQDGYDYVMLVNKDQDEKGNTIYRINRHKVSLGERQEDYVVLTEPLSPNVAVVRQGGSFLNDGDIVRIANLDTPNDNTSNRSTSDSSTPNSNAPNSNAPNSNASTNTAETGQNL